MQAKVKHYWTKYLNVIKAHKAGVYLDEAYKNPSATKQEIWADIASNRVALNGKLLSVIISTAQRFTAAFVYKTYKTVRLRLYTPSCTYDEELSDEQVRELYDTVFPHAPLPEEYTAAQLVDYLDMRRVL